MLISLCIPCMNRTYSLRETLSSVIQSANASPPVEITVINYNSQDDLDEYIKTINGLIEGNFLTYIKYNKGKYYNSPHARNLSVLLSKGDYIVQLDTEIILEKEFVSYIRSRLEVENLTWMCEEYSGRCIVIKKQEFIDAGGYDERFILYAPEDRDICARLHRRGGKFEIFSKKLLHDIYTPNDEKIRNKNLEQFEGKKVNIKREMGKLMHQILDENNEKVVLVANEGKDWGVP